MKTIVCGPSHSGKSVFINELLHRMMPSDDYLCIRANGDGDGNWINNPNQKETNEVRAHNKSSDSPEDIETWRKLIDNAAQRIVIVDIDGRLSDNKIPLFRACDSFIVISNDDEKKKEWIEFGVSHGCHCIAAINSTKDNADEIISTKPYIEGRIGPLERGVRFEGRNIITRIADELVTRSGYKNITHSEFIKNNDGSIVVDFYGIGEKLGYGNRWTASNGVNVCFVNFPLTKASELYHYLCKHYGAGTYYKFYGANANWVAGIAANALSDGNPSNISYFERWTDYYISPCKLRKVKSPKNTDIDVNVSNGADAIVIDITMKKGKVAIDNDCFGNYQLPIIDESKVLLISGKLPTWFLVSIMMSYSCKEVYTRIPGLTKENESNYVCIKTENPNNFGNIYQRYSLNTTGKENKKRSLDEELYRRIHNFLNKAANDFPGRRFNNIEIIESIGFEYQQKTGLYKDFAGDLADKSAKSFTQRLHEITSDIDRRLKDYGYEWNFKEGQRRGMTYCYKEIVPYDFPSEYVFEKNAQALLFKGFIGYKNSDNKTGKKQRDIISFSTNPLLSNISLVKEVFYAIIQERVIEFDYDATNSNHIKHVVLSPHFIKEFNQRWFFWGYAESVTEKETSKDCTNEKTREGLGSYTFRVDSIANLRILIDGNYTYHSAQPSVNYSSMFDDIVGVTHFLESRPVDVYITTYDYSTHRRIKTKPIHSTQIELEAYDKGKNSHGKFKLHVCINPELETILLSYGDTIKAEWEGKSYNKFLERISKMNHRYQR